MNSRSHHRHHLKYDAFGNRRFGNSMAPPIARPLVLPYLADTTSKTNMHAQTKETVPKKTEQPQKDTKYCCLLS